MNTPLSKILMAERILELANRKLSTAYDDDEILEFASALLASAPASSAVQGAMTDELCEILSTVLHFIPKEEAQLSDDVHSMCSRLRDAQPSDATAQPAGLLQAAEQMYLALCEELAAYDTPIHHVKAAVETFQEWEAAQPKVDLADERSAFEEKLPLPANCVRCGDDYASTAYSAWDAHKQVERWKGWKARALLANTAQTDHIGDANNMIEQDAVDAERWRWATALEDNAEMLHSILLCHGGEQEKINERADAYRLQASQSPQDQEAI